MAFWFHQTLRLINTAGLNRRMRKTACPGGVGGDGIQSVPDPICNHEILSRSHVNR